MIFSCRATGLVLPKRAVGSESRRVFMRPSGRYLGDIRGSSSAQKYENIYESCQTSYTLFDTHSWQHRRHTKTTRCYERRVGGRFRRAKAPKVEQNVAGSCARLEQSVLPFTVITIQSRQYSHLKTHSQNTRRMRLCIVHTVCAFRVASSLLCFLNRFLLAAPPPAWPARRVHPFALPS